MAHSGQEFRGKYLSLKDGAIVAAIVLAKQSDITRKNSEIVAEWMHQLEISGPGTIDLKLDDYLQSAEDVSEFVVLLNAVRAKVRTFGEVVPASVLNGKDGSAPMGFVFIDLRSQIITSLLDELESLVR